jgi:hypothetical protein
MKQEAKRINIKNLKIYLNTRYEKHWQEFTEN